MNWKKTVFEREKLFDEVWEKPMLHLSKSYGLSDVGLRKICVALEIPLPPRGYWARGDRSINKKPILPATSGITVYEHRRHEPHEDATLTARIQSARDAMTAQVALSGDYTAPLDTSGFQTQTNIVRTVLNRVRPKGGLREISEVCWADVSVSEMLLERALLLVDRAAFELTRLGAHFENSHPQPQRLSNGRRVNPDQVRNCFTLHGRDFFVRIREKNTTSGVGFNHSPQASPQAVPAQVGELQFCIVDAPRYYERFKIQDSSRGTIELKVRKVIAEVYDITLSWKISRELSAEREAIRRSKAQDWEKLKEKKDALLSQLTRFESMAKDLERARSLRRLIAEVETTNSAPPELTNQLALMKLMANWLDPMVKAHWPGVDGVGEKNPYGTAW